MYCLFYLSFILWSSRYKKQPLKRAVFYGYLYCVIIHLAYLALRAVSGYLIAGFIFAILMLPAGAVC